MRTRRPQSRTLTLPLAFLSAAFMLGCQDQGSSPVEPDGLAPAFRHGGPPPHPPKEPGGGVGTGDGTYLYTFSGDIGTDPSPAGAGGSAGINDDGLVGLRGAGSEEEEALLFLNQFGECFGANGSVFRVDKFTGQLRRDKKDPMKVQAVFNFKASGKDPLTEFNYNIKLDGLVGVTTDNDDAIWPPEPGETTTVDFATTITMNTKGGKDNSAVACTDSKPVTQPTSVELTGTS